MLLEVLTLFLPVGYNVGMKKQQEEMTIEFMDELDLSRVPKDIFDAFLDALEETIIIRTTGWTLHIILNSAGHVKSARRVDFKGTAKYI